jgi:hypothetical protein
MYIKGGAKIDHEAAHKRSASVLLPSTALNRKLPPASEATRRARRGVNHRQRHERHNDFKHMRDPREREWHLSYTVPRLPFKPYSRVTSTASSFPSGAR